MSVFGPEFEQVWPKAGSALKLTEFGKNLLKKCETVEPPSTEASKIDLKEFMRKSSNFPIEFGTNTCRVISQPKERHPFIQQQIASAYPVIHERVLGLYLNFLEHKCKYGNKVELEIYPRLSLTGLVDRLLAKRCVSFLGFMDQYQLLSGEKGVGNYRTVGTPDETPPLVIKDVLSYDEVKLSAFLSVSSHTEFLNDGNRHNAGIIEMDKSKIEPEGVVVGLIGGRFEAPNVMEWEDMVISKEQNTAEHGYGQCEPSQNITRSSNYRQLYRDFYEEPDLIYEVALKMDTPRLYKIPRTHFIFDNLMMKKRYTISFDTLLLESEARAARINKQAYVHIVGIGLGVWQVGAFQKGIFLETFAQRLKTLVSKLPHVGVVHFSWFHTNEYGDLKDGGIFKSTHHPNGGIRTFLSNRNPNEKLKRPEHANMLAIVSYAWDGNALPGNEFWRGSLTGSGDPAAACSTLITELHNPHINSERVNGRNLHIASEQGGVLHIAKYVEMILK